MDVDQLAPSRPPCSRAELQAAHLVASALTDRGIEARLEPFRAPTSPTWTPLVQALLRVWAAAFVAARWPGPAAGAAAVALIGGVGPFRDLWRRVPGLGGTSSNVVAKVAGRTSAEPPLVLAAHLDTHPTGGAPLARAHRVVAGASTLLVLAAALGTRFGTWPGWRTIAALVAIEAVATITWLARREFAATPPVLDDNASGLLALVRTAEQLHDEPPLRECWLVATGAATAGGHGMTVFLRTHPEVARLAWIIEFDALGAGEIVVCPARRRLPQRVTPAAVVRAVAGAAIDTGDPIDVRRMRRPHSDARAALSRGATALTLTGGLRPAESPPGPDLANAERAARIVDHLARTES